MPPINKKELEEMTLEQMVQTPDGVEPLIEEIVADRTTVEQYMPKSSAPQQTVTEKRPVGRRGGQRSEKATEMIAALDGYFEGMKSGEKANNHDLVKFLDSKGFEVSKSAIPTDVPLNYAPKTKAMIDGVVSKVKDDPDKKRPMWMYLRV